MHQITAELLKGMQEDNDHMNKLSIGGLGTIKYYQETVDCAPIYIWAPTSSLIACNLCNLSSGAFRDNQSSSSHRPTIQGKCIAVLYCAANVSYHIGNQLIHVRLCLV